MINIRKMWGIGIAFLLFFFVSGIRAMERHNGGSGDCCRRIKRLFCCPGENSKQRVVRKNQQDSKPNFSVKAINSQESSVVSDIDEESAEEEQLQEICLSCMQVIKNSCAKLSPCGHLFHIGCLSRWRNQQQRAGCPSCASNK